MKCLIRKASDLQNNAKSSQVCGPQPCELYFYPNIADTEYIRILQIRNIMDNWQANECFFHNQSTFTTSPLIYIEKNIIFIQYNDYIEYFYYLCDVEKEEPAGS